MRRTRGAGVVAALAAGLALVMAGGCTSFSTEETPDAGASDASAPDAATADVAAPQGEGFETARAGCGDWEAKAGTVERSATGGHSGPGACRICSPGGKDGAFFGAIGPVPGVQPGVYSLEAYVLHEIGTPALLAAAFDSSGTFIEGSETAAPSTWTQITKSVTVADGGTLRAIISGRSVGTTASCFLVDDIVIRKER